MTHGRKPIPPFLRQLRSLLGALILLVLVVALPGPDAGEAGQADAVSGGLTLEHGRILSVGEVDPETFGRTAEVLLLEGERAGETVTADLGSTDPSAPGDPMDATDGPPAPYAPGDEVIIQIASSADGEFIAVADRWRVPVLGWIVVGFAALVSLVAGWRGVRALIALALTVAVIVRWLLPLLIVGWDPVALAVLTGSAVTVATLLLTEGWNRATFSAAVGTFGALLATAVVAALVTDAARFSVFQGSEEVGFLRSMTGLDVELGGLLLASVILGALGVLDDVTVTQAVTVEELAAADPNASRATLAGRAMTIGRAHIAATVNTLVLAYVAASLPLLLLFALAPQPLGALASSEVVAVEVVRAVVGSIGIVLAVPFTTFVAARLVPRG